MRAATFATSSRRQEIPFDESCRLAVGSLNGPLTLPSRCTLPRVALSAWPHHFAAFWSSLSLTTRTSIDGCCLMSASMPSITPRSSGALNSRFINCRSRPSNEMSLWSVSMRVLVVPMVRSSGASSARRPRDDRSTVSAGALSVMFADSSLYSTASRGTLIRAIGSGAGVLSHPGRRAMRGHDRGFMRHVESSQYLICLAHRFPVRLAAHDHSNQRTKLWHVRISS